MVHPTPERRTTPRLPTFPTAGASGPAGIIIRDARVLQASGEEASGTVVTRGDRIVSIDSERRADPAGLLEIDEAGLSVVPLVDRTVDRILPAQERERRSLRPGHEATFAVVRGGVSASRIAETFIVRPAALVAVLVAGRLVALEGHAMSPPGLSDGVNSGRLGDWHDPDRGLIQRLFETGRYSETRNQVADAYTGQFWIVGTRVVYLDDSGFWAFGQWVQNELHHAGFVMRRS
jgi:hypothetical protein